ncbi:hypothetical protein [Halobacillus ihumii]|uniref:hypothetical protein n=1 Tax=Halobacillus ihumii TaxID=2686092 RepID=UPI0013D10879|nr:hypothetical protein [Halobacillus ihumii]
MEWTISQTLSKLGFGRVMRKNMGMEFYYLNQIPIKQKKENQQKKTTSGHPDSG